MLCAGSATSRAQREENRRARITTDVRDEKTDFVADWLESFWRFVARQEGAVKRGRRPARAHSATSKRCADRRNLEGDVRGTDAFSEATRHNAAEAIDRPPASRFRDISSLCIILTLPSSTSLNFSPTIPITHPQHHTSTSRKRHSHHAKPWHRTNQR